PAPFQRFSAAYLFSRFSSSPHGSAPAPTSTRPAGMPTAACKGVRRQTRNPCPAGAKVFSSLRGVLCLYVTFATVLLAKTRRHALALRMRRAAVDSSALIEG